MLSILEVHTYGVVDRVQLACENDYSFLQSMQRARLDPRARRAIIRMGIKSWEGLSSVTADELLELPQVGWVTVQQIERALQIYGLTLS